MSKKNVSKEELKEGLKINKKIIIIVSIVLIVIITLIMLFLTVFNKDWQNASKDYKEIMEVAKKNNEELEDLIDQSQKLVNSKENALDEELRANLEDAISDAKAVKKKLPHKPLFASAIEEKIKYLEDIKYEEEYSALKEAYDALEKSFKQYALVDQPDESYVIESLRKISSIDKISAVTEDNDPNGKLNKQGGYTAQVYFSSKYVNQKNISGKTVIDKGTKAGGSIEVYRTVEDAKKREDYLAGFDGGVLASGSHKVIGTVLIRTSDELTATKQKELEADIIAALTGEELKESTDKEDKTETKKPVNNSNNNNSAAKKPEVDDSQIYSVVGTYKGFAGTVTFYDNGTLTFYWTSINEHGDGSPTIVTGTWTQNNDTYFASIVDESNVRLADQSSKVYKNGIYWWGDFYSRVS